MGTEIVPVILILLCAIVTLPVFYWAVRSKRSLKVRLCMAAITMLPFGVVLQPFFSGLGKDPEGHIEGQIYECFGGNLISGHDNKPPSYVAFLDLEQSEWNKLDNVLEEFSNENELRLFKDIRDDPMLQMFSVYICSSEGLYIHVIQQIWRPHDADPPRRFPLAIMGIAYKNDAKWSSIINQLSKVLFDTWPDELRTANSSVD